MGGRSSAIATADHELTPRRRALLPSGLLANGAALALSAGNTLLTAVLLGAVGRGQIAVLTVVASYGVVAVGLSLEAGILHHGAGLGPAATAALRRRTGWVALGTFALGILVLAVACLATVGPALPAGIVAVFAVGYACPVLVPPATAWDRLQGRHHAATWRPVLVLVAQQLGGALGLWFRPTVEAFVVASAVASAFAVAITLGLHLRARGPQRAARADEHPSPGARRLVGYSLRGHGGVLLHLYAMRVPLIAVSVALGAATAGLFSVASAIAEVTIIVSQAQLGRVLAAATSDRSDFSVLRQQLRLGVLLSVGLGVVLVAVAAIAPRFLPPDFAGLLAPTAVLVPGIVALGAWRLAAYDLAARGWATARSTSAAVGAVAITILLVVLVPPLGAVGAALAATTGFLLMPPALWWLTRDTVARGVAP